MREIIVKSHENEVYIHIYEGKTTINLQLTEKEASDLSTQLGFACQDIDVVRNEKKKFAAMKEFLRPTLEKLCP